MQDIINKTPTKKLLNKKGQVKKSPLSFDIEEQSPSIPKISEAKREHYFVKKKINLGDSSLSSSIVEVFTKASSGDITKEKEDTILIKQHKEALECDLNELSITDTKSIHFSNEHFRIESTPTKGRCVIAAKALKPGQLVLKEGPVAFVVDDSEYKNRCFSCFKSSSGSISDEGYKVSELGPQVTIINARLSLSRCSRCKLAWYCSKDCQLRDWATYHKKECASFAKHKEPGPASIRLMAKLLILSRGAYPSSFKDMVSNRQLFSLQEVKKFGEMSLLLHGFIDNSELTATQLIELWCKLQCNGFSICDDELSKIGVGLFEKAACFNHSCRPNAYAHFNGHNLELRVIEAIKLEQEITIAYIDTFEPQTIRKKNLMRQYFFDCSCEKCGLEKSKPTTRLDYLPCPLCKEALFVNEFSCVTNGPLSCSCSLEPVLHELKSTYKSFISLTSPEVKGQPPRAIEDQIKSLRAIEERFQKLSVPTSHYFMLKLSHSLIGSLLQSIFSLLESSKVIEACTAYKALTNHAESYVEALGCADASRLHPFISNTYFNQSTACFQIWDFLAHNQRCPLYGLLEDYSEKLSAILNTALYNVNLTHGQQSSTYIQLSQFSMSLASFHSQK